MTFKTIFIVVAIVVFFASILSITWDISSWVFRGPDPAPVVETVEPAKSMKADTGGDNGDGAGGTQASTPQEAKSDQDQAVEQGVYDDSWTGSPEPSSEAGENPAPIRIPEPAEAATTKNNAKVEPYSPDDRDGQAQDPKMTGPAAVDGPTADPYRQDERETN